MLKSILSSGPKLGFSVSKKVFKVENISKPDKIQTLSNINIIFSTLNSLLSISNELDKGVISPVNAGSKVNSLKSDIKIANLINNKWDIIPFCFAI